ncbi:sigma-70 family RNA polymerase sigma factor [Lysinibacillus mangiferihumi]|uniref:Sigma-70 family RNA polymerase sigma factor n=1 Tax=Lysinibacillus mangiferihumi TaxID=1130819 RepID=A0A4U2YID2_9BACI|nr:sigma-70 family RNA polymerase sigma factor [Lysinibacillus mangiferihumi]TKI60052.1 sigma-70 family RNA polymerase sigma factor [Lysinibacillus mangiferihumi]
MNPLEDERFQSIVNENNDYLLKLSYLYVKDWNTAEDIVQEVFIKYWVKSEQFQAQASLRTYLTRMAINRCKDYLKSWRYRTQTLTNIFTDIIRNKNQLILQDEKLIVAEAILSLPIKFREVIILYYYNELTIQKISNILNTSESTINYRLKKARERLKDLLSTQQWEVLLNE